MADIIYSPYKKIIIDSIITSKKISESKLIAYCIKSVTFIFSSALYYQIESESGIGKEHLMVLTAAFIIGNDSFINSKSEEFIDIFYKNKDETLFKSEIDGFIYTLLYAIAISCTGTKQCYVDNLFPDIANVLSIKEKNVLTNFRLSSNIINSLLKKLIGVEVKNFSKKIGEKNIEKAFSIYKNQIGTHMPKGMCYFILAIIEKMLSVGMKITKNDMIDSQLLYYYPSLQLFTCDIRLKNIIKEFDKNYYDFIILFENKCKI